MQSELTRVQRRHERKKAALVGGAWELAREQGLAQISQRALAERLDLAQPSLYSYFASKNDLYDAMFADGNEQLLMQVGGLELPEEPRAAVKAFFARMTDFCVSDPTRYQLLFQRTIPGFEPSPSSYALAMEFYERARAVLIAAGVGAQEQLDVFVALMAGIQQAQLANDPGGDRWVRHQDWVIDMFFDQLARDKEASP